MNTGKGSNSTAVAPATYSFGENPEQAISSQAMALVALSHTTVEHQLYSAMLTEIATVGTRVASFTTRGLMSLTGINGYSSVRRGLIGLANKLFTPEEILARRRARGVPAYPKGVENEHGLASLAGPLKRIVNLRNLSRREAQVALCCAQGLTNAEIGARLQVSEQTIKFHLRNIFVKFGVKRRAELVSRLFRDRVGSIDFSL